MQQKRTLLALHLKKISYMVFFKKLSAKRVLFPLGNIFKLILLIKLIGVLVKRQTKLGHRIGLVENF